MKHITVTWLVRMQCQQRRPVSVQEFRGGHLSGLSDQRKQTCSIGFKQPSLFALPAPAVQITMRQTLGKVLVSPHMRHDSLPSALASQAGTKKLNSPHMSRTVLPPTGAAGCSTMQPQHQSTATAAPAAVIHNVKDCRTRILHA
jgi:hypothetical protein